MIALLSNVSTSSPTSSFLSVVGQLITVIFVLCVTIGFIYLVAYVAKKLNFGGASFSGRNLNVLEYKNIGNNNSLALTKVGTKYILLSVSKDNVRFICELKEEELNFEETINQENVDFKELFNSKLKDLKNFSGRK